jgi:hypothetical protein
VRSVKPFKTQGTLKVVYFGCFHSVINFGSISWDNALRSAKILKYNRIELELLQDAEVENHVEIYLKI